MIIYNKLYMIIRCDMALAIMYLSWFFKYSLCYTVYCVVLYFQPAINYFFLRWNNQFILHLQSWMLLSDFPWPRPPWPCGHTGVLSVGTLVGTLWASLWTHCGNACGHIVGTLVGMVRCGHADGHIVGMLAGKLWAPLLALVSTFVGKLWARL